jgi:hypothetical protein
MKSLNCFMTSNNDVKSSLKRHFQSVSFYSHKVTDKVRTFSDDLYEELRRHTEEMVGEQRKVQRNEKRTLCCYCLLGGYREREIPDPIPNSEVKPLVADGTILKSMGE